MKQELTRRVFIRQAGMATLATMLPPFAATAKKTNSMYDVIIAGGSYSGLSAALTLGRSLRRVLLIDSSLPCNRQTPYSHNFLTQDGVPPGTIGAIGRTQVNQYDSVKFQNGLVTAAAKKGNHFIVETNEGASFAARKLLFATGIRDLLPGIPGLAACWGISVLHCPYCHGYEVKGMKTGLLANGETAYPFSLLLANWTKDLTLFTNGKSTLTAEQSFHLQKQGIPVNESEISHLEEDNGNLKAIHFQNGQTETTGVLYTRPPFEQHCPVPEALGCLLTGGGFIRVDDQQRTTVPGVFASGDNCSSLRTVANAVASGTAAGMTINKELCIEDWAEPL